MCCAQALLKLFEARQWETTAEDPRQRVLARARGAGNLIEVGTEWQRIRSAAARLSAICQACKTFVARPISANKTVL
jgi:hypothetical protein